MQVYFYLKIGKLVTFLIADTTGSIVLEMISPSAPLFNTGDIIRINSAQGSLQNDHLKILAHGNIIRIGDFCKHYSDVPNYSNFEWKTVDNRFVRGSLVAGSTDGWLCDALRGSTSRPGSGKKARI